MIISNTLHIEKMNKDDICRLIEYHQNGLDQYRLQMSPSIQYLEEQTIKALKELINKE